MEKVVDCGRYGSIRCGVSSPWDDDDASKYAETANGAAEAAEKKLIDCIRRLTQGGKKRLNIELADALTADTPDALRALAKAATGKEYKNPEVGLFRDERDHRDAISFAIEGRVQAVVLQIVNATEDDTDDESDGEGIPSSARSKRPLGGESSPEPVGDAKSARTDVEPENGSDGDPFVNLVELNDSEDEDGRSPEPAGDAKSAPTDDEGGDDTDSDTNGEQEVTFRARRHKRPESYVASNVKKYMRQYEAKSGAVRNLFEPGIDPLTTMYEVCDALAATEIAAKRRAVGLLTQVFITAANARCDQAEHEIDVEKLERSRRLELAQKRAKLKAIGAKIGDARAAGKTPNPRTVKSQGILKARVDQLIRMLGANTSSPEAGPA